MYRRSRYEASSPMSVRNRKLRLTRKAFLYREMGREEGDPPSFQAKKKFHEDDDLVFPPGIMRSQRRKLDRALSFFTTDPPKYLTLGNIAILRLSSVFPSPYIWRWCIPSQQFLHLSISPISIRFSIPIFSPVVPFFFFLYLYIYIRTRSNVFGMFNTQIINWSFTFDVHFIEKRNQIRRLQMMTKING